MIAEALVDRLVATASTAELRRLALHLLGEEGGQLDAIHRLTEQVAKLAKAPAAPALLPTLEAVSDDDDADVDAVLAAIGYERAR